MAGAGDVFRRRAELDGEPDAGARAELYAIIRQLADTGVAVLLVSSEVPEVLGLADRVLVLRDGRIVHESPAQELDESGVLDLVMEGSAV